MNGKQTFLVFGATGQTGQHFTRLALEDGHHIRALARTPGKLAIEHDRLEIEQGSITGGLDYDTLLSGVDAVIAMLGDATAQREHKVNTEFVQTLVPAMRRSGTRRFLYQAGGLSAAPGKRLSPALRLVRSTIARGFIGQHDDNESVMRYLDEQAQDIEWIVHRAGIGSDGPSKGTLQRSASAISIGTFVDCARYNLTTVMDDSAIHSCDGSSYRHTR